jgi:hypothetical protein
MKLTWFGADTVRVYIGGAILVLNADQAPATIDQAELLSGADQVITKTSLPLADLATWRFLWMQRASLPCCSSPNRAFNSAAGRIRP